MSARLEAINAMLRVIGEFAVDSQLDTHPDVTTAKSLLTDTRREILSEGWWCNMRVEAMNPDTQGRIFVPSTTMTIDAVDASRNVSLRDGQLYDEDNKTFVFKKSVLCELVLDSDEQDLPPLLMSRIKWDAVVQFAGINQVTGEAVRIAEEKLMESRTRLTSERYRKADVNFSDNKLARRVNRFRGRYQSTNRTTLPRNLKGSM